MSLYLQTNIPERYDNSGRVFEFPSDHHAVDRGNGWVNVQTADGQKIASIKSDSVLAIYKDFTDEQESKVPVDTRLNYLTLQRDARGRFTKR